MNANDFRDHMKLFLRKGKSYYKLTLTSSGVIVSATLVSSCLVSGSSLFTGSFVNPIIWKLLTNVQNYKYSNMSNKLEM